MFDPKKLQLASYGHLDFYYFQSFLSHFNNASLMNLNGDLLYSKDTEICSTTTSRLVSYQIVKRYLKLSPGDIFMTNDPENGGYHYSKVFFISALTENLFLVWTEDLDQIQFKIPLSPLTEKNKKNEMLWNALIEAHPQKTILSDFFNLQIENYGRCFRAHPYLSFLSDSDFQKIWFITCKSEFDRQFELRAQGQGQISLNYKGKLIKTNLLIEEKQNQKNLSIDFSNTQLADELCAASHIIESALIQEFVYYYKLHNYLSQSILNQFKLILPPKSVISKAHPQGLYNFELQSLIRQIFKFLISQLSTKKKADSTFAIKSEALLKLTAHGKSANGFLLDHRLSLENFNSTFKSHQQFMKDNYFQCEFLVLENSQVSGQMSLETNYLCSEQDQNKRVLKLNQKVLKSGKTQLVAGDLLQIQWKI